MFNIIEPQECAVSGFTMQVAEHTRSALADLVASAKLPENTSDFVPDKAAEKELREAGKAAFVKAYSELTDDLIQGVVDVMQEYDVVLSKEEVAGVLPVAKLYLAINRAANAVQIKNPNYLHISGIVSAAKAAAYRDGIKVEDKKSKAVAWTLASAPRCTSGSLDRVMSRVNAWPGINYKMTHNVEEQYEYHPLESYIPTNRQGCGYYESAHGLITVEGEAPMFHGFLSSDDFYALRFTSTRVGAAVKQWGCSDEQARRATATCNNKAEHTYKFYPNDCSFGDIYIDFDNHEGMDSCMSGDDFCDVPHGVHPADAYSAAHFGVEDNGLVLIVAFLDGRIIGRGILNVNKNEVVRWYGRHKAWVQLENMLDISLDSDALEDSWLALIADGGKFAHPYVDGTEYGEINGDRVLLGTGEIDLQNTAGYGYIEPTHMCVYDDDTYPESEMTHQPESDTWIHDRNIRRATRCVITGEYFHSFNIVDIWLEGKCVSVWEDLNLDRLGYSEIGGNIGWTQDPDQYYFDDETGRYYEETEYAELIAEREEQENDEDSNANAA